MIRQVVGTDALLLSVLRVACADVVTYCRVRNAPAKKGSYMHRLQGQFTQEVAIESMAWLLGTRPGGAVPVDAVCLALGLRHICIIDRLEEMIGHEAFLQLQELSQGTSS